jgi:hypothetical protein
MVGDLVLKKPIPDPGVKKALNPGSTTLGTRKAKDHVHVKTVFNIIFNKT